jgi:hypothetical protein
MINQDIETFVSNHMAIMELVKENINLKGYIRNLQEEIKELKTPKEDFSGELDTDDFIVK